MTAAARPSPSHAIGPVLGQGRTADVHAWGDDRIVKLFHPGLPSAYSEREARIAVVVSATDVPAPRFHEVVTVGERFGLVYDRVSGPPMLAILAGQPWRGIGLARQLAKIHAAIHQVVLVDDALPTQRDYLRNAILDSPTRTESLRAAALDELDQLPDGDRLCHGDFHPDNVLITGQGPIVIDWITGTRGEPAGDVARTLMLLQFGGLPPGASRLTAVVTRLFRRVFAAVYWLTYRRLTGMTQVDLDRWMRPVMTARLRESVPDSEKARLIEELVRT